MESRSLLFGIIGFLLGGLLVSVAATTFDKPEITTKASMSQMTDSLKDKQGDAFDEAFIAEMIDHHQAAIDMAKMSAGRAKHPEIKSLSRNIISTQQKEIDTMRQWQTEWGYSSAGSMSH